MNPFIELYRDPVGALTALAYALVLLATIVVVAGLTWRNTLQVKAWWDNQRPHQWKFYPPVTFVLYVALNVFAAGVLAALLAALIWLVTP